MPKRSSKKPRVVRDENQIAAGIVAQIVAEHDPDAPKPEPAKNPAAVALGKLGGLKGGRARAEKLTPEQRSKIARKAAAKRWKKDGSR